MIKKLLGAIVLPLYTLLSVLALILWCMVLFINQENKAVGRAVKSFGFMIERMYYRFYGDADERDN
jgi:hypothetical protein